MFLSKKRRKERKILRKVNYFQKEGYRLSTTDRARSSQMYAEADRLMQQIVVENEIHQQGRP